MEQMLSADHLEILTWIVERDMGDYACPDAQFVSPALVHNLTEAARLEGELGSEAYHALHPDAEDLALKSWVVMMIFLKRCSLVGFPIYADLHWTLLGQRVLCAHPQLHTQRAHIGTLASDIVSTLSQTYRCKYAYIYMDGWIVPSTIRVVMGRPLARFCRSALYMQGMSCFPGGLPPSSTGRIALHPSPERTLSCSMVGDLEPIPTFYLSKHLE